MAYEVVMPYHLHMPSYFLETFTEYPQLLKSIPIYTYIQKVSRLSLKKNLELFLYSED